MTERKPTLLVVDDVAANIDILIEALGKDYTVRVDTDGAAALGSVKEFRPDLILLDISKMEAGQMALDYSAVKMSNLVRETIRMIAPLREHRRITLTPPGQMEALSGDVNLVRRILQNLIVNAIKFTGKDKGIITLRIESTSEDKVRVSIADNGPGIPLEYREKVFDKFCQVAARKQGQGRSSGLGLTFCRLAVEAHGGRIGLETDEGKGSTFWFELPKKRKH